MNITMETPAMRAAINDGAILALWSVWETRELSDQMARRDRIACVPFIVADGLSAGLREYILAGGHIAFPEGKP